MQPGQQLPVVAPPHSSLAAAGGPRKSLDQIPGGGQAFPGQGFAGPSFSPYQIPAAPGEALVPAALNYVRYPQLIGWAPALTSAGAQNTTFLSRYATQAPFPIHSVSIPVLGLTEHSDSSA